MKHKILPVFIPFAGCLNRCIFCDQRAITGISSGINRESIQSQIQTYLSYSDYWDEIAFYGGSFTCLSKSERALMYEIAEENNFATIRVSTRPDCIFPEIVSECVAHRVQFIEIGVQTLNDVALEMNKRPYVSADVFNAIRLLSGNTKIGVQVMPGMYGDSFQGFCDTIDQLICDEIDTGRIYPTCVYPGTELEQMMDDGRYMPLSLADAIMLTAYAYVRFSCVGIDVIRMGVPLGSGDAEPIGPIHSAFGDLVKSYLLLLYCDAISLEGQNTLLPMQFSGYKSVVAEKYPHCFDKVNVERGPLWQKILSTVQEMYFESDSWFTQRKIIDFAKEIECKANNG